MDVVMLLVSLGLILLASILFTNGIELLGHRLKFHQGAVGGILASVGTALPETVIPIIAILVFRGDPDAQQVGIGAIAGAPFMLATLAMFVTGAAVVIHAAMGRRTLALKVAPRQLGLDLTFFVSLYGTAVLVTFAHDVPFVKVPVAIGLLLAYVWYVRKTLLSECVAMEECDLLILGRVLRRPQSLPLVLVQVAGAVALMVVGAHMFVRHVAAVAAGAGVPALILSIVITPVATELPEKFNSILWIGRRKDILALGNITGAMVFQSSFPVVFGILFTPWDLRGPTMVSAVLALLSALLVLAWVKIWKSLNPYVLMVGGLLYAAFLVYLFRGR